MNDRSNPPPRQVPPGWYPDPQAPGTGTTRWWDGFKWSQEHVREAPRSVPLDQPIIPPGQTVPARGQVLGTTAQSYVQPEENEANQTYALLAMLVGGLLLLGRVYYMMHASNQSTAPGCQSGAVVGNLVGALLTGLLFAWGVTRYKGIDGFEQRHMWPIAVGSAVAVVAAGALLS